MHLKKALLKMKIISQLNLALSTLFIVFTLSLDLHGQVTKIKGSVYDLESNEALPYVSIAVAGKPRGTITDEKKKSVCCMVSILCCMLS